MNVAAVVLLGLTTAVGVVFWRIAARRRFDVPDASAIVAAAIPVLLLATAALLALRAPGPATALAQIGVAVGTAAAVTGGGILAPMVLQLADRSPRHGVAGAEPGVGTGSVADPDTLRGGAWVGVLERLAVVATLLARWPEGLAVVLAVKGVGRYPELGRPAAAERFIIGSFTSILWAAAVAGTLVALIE